MAQLGPNMKRILKTSLDKCRLNLTGVEILIKFRVYLGIIIQNAVKHLNFVSVFGRKIGTIYLCS